MCKYSASRLNISWLSVITETTICFYFSKKKSYFPGHRIFDACQAWCFLWILSFPCTVGILARFARFGSGPLGTFGQANSWRFGRLHAAVLAWTGAAWSERWRSSRLSNIQTLWLSKMFSKVALKWCSFWSCELTNISIKRKLFTVLPTNLNMFSVNANPPLHHNR